MFDIYVPIYKSLFCAEYQIKTLKNFFLDDHQLIIIDQNMGRHPENSRKLKEMCEKNDVLYGVNTDDECFKYQMSIESGNLDISLKLGRTLNVIYNSLVKERENPYFGFLDQDCFLFRPSSIKEYLDDKKAYGKVVPTHVYEEQHKTLSGDYAWNLHVICNFFNYDFVKDKNLNFMPGTSLSIAAKLDTGGMNYEVIYKDLNKADYILKEEHYLYYDDTSLLNSTGNKPTNVLYEIVDDKFVHMVHNPVVETSKDYLNPKISYMKGLLDFSLLQNAGPGLGASSRPDFVPTYRDADRHPSFDQDKE